jgi:hypothetical protein
MSKGRVNSSQPLSARWSPHHSSMLPTVLVLFASTEDFDTEIEYFFCLVGIIYQWDWTACHIVLSLQKPEKPKGGESQKSNWIWSFPKPQPKISHIWVSHCTSISAGSDYKFCSCLFWHRQAAWAGQEHSSNLAPDCSDWFVRSMLHLLHVPTLQ